MISLNVYLDPEEALIDGIKDSEVPSVQRRSCLSQGNRGPRVHRTRGVALMLVFLMMILMKLRGPSDWALPSLGALLVPLSLLILFCLFLQGVQAIRHRRPKAATLSDSVNEYATKETGRKAGSLKEKWLLRIAYYGTFILVAFILWAYVKAK